MVVAVKEEEASSSEAASSSGHQFNFYVNETSFFMFGFNLISETLLARYSITASKHGSCQSTESTSPYVDY
ncbi:hypothetical protein Pmani_038226 [Petrolisthes manimaculis]|uniref:Uncharacterized protein n=1 Tax=Petrolisthes manimaculis TaxID=1843537 RepID=A0AAE1TKG6_9EUCA|nr:hypothetical protein Pmani_038226 [Petrolisthes manimaculis]